MTDEIMTDEMTRENRVPRRDRRSVSAWVMIAALGVLSMLCYAGCGGASRKFSPATPGLPIAPAAAKANSYVGTQGLSTGNLGVSGMLTAFFDDSTGSFTFQSGALNPKYGGTDTAASGFLDLTVIGSGSSANLPFNINPGYAVEIPGRAMLLRPGDTTYAPALLVPSIASAVPVCQTFTGPLTLQFVTLPDVNDSIVNGPLYGAPNAGPAFGSLQVSQNALNYTFSNLQRFYLNGSSSSPPALQAGVCGQTQSGSVISVAADAASNLPPTALEIGPTGFVFMDQTLLGSIDARNGRPASIGVVQPSSPLDVGAIADGKYVGFKYEPVAGTTQPVAFGLTSGPAAGIVGGVYPGDDLTQTPLADTTIAFGTQLASNNGLFSASVTVPDPNGVCAASGQGTVGTDGSGNPTCAFPAVVVAGNPEGKFALFLIANDLVNGSPLGMYLFQQ